MKKIMFVMMFFSLPGMAQTVRDSTPSTHRVDPSIRALDQIRMEAQQRWALAEMRANKLSDELEDAQARAAAAEAKLAELSKCAK